MWLAGCASRGSVKAGWVDVCVSHKRVDKYFAVAISVVFMGATAASERILRELATTIGGYGAAIEMDIDRSDDDRSFFMAERAFLQGWFDKVSHADLDWDQGGS